MINALLSQLQQDLLFSDRLSIALAFGRIKELRIQLVEAVMHNCPAYFFIAIAANDRKDPAWTRAWNVAGGRGLSRADARLSAVLEALERASLFRDGPEDPRLAREVSGQEMFYNTEDIVQFSSRQLRELQAKWQYITTSSCELSVDKQWIRGKILGKEAVAALPADVVLFPESGDREILASSSGAAVRDTIDAAAAHALFELVERDAVAIWWYNRLVPRRLAADDSAALLAAPLADFLADRSRVTWHLVLDTDLPAAVVVAVSCRADGGRPAIGAAAKPSLADAVSAATLEMLQIEIALGQMRAAAALPGAEPPPLLSWSDAANAISTPYLLGSDEDRPAPTGGSVDALVTALVDGGIDVVIVDLTRPEIGLPVVRAVSPHLRDWLPRFGPGRLYDVPVRLGLRDKPTPEADLNIPFVL